MASPGINGKACLTLLFVVIVCEPHLYTSDAKTTNSAYSPFNIIAKRRSHPPFHKYTQRDCIAYITQYLLIFVFLMPKQQNSGKSPFNVIAPHSSQPPLHKYTLRDSMAKTAWLYRYFNISRFMCFRWQCEKCDKVFHDKSVSSCITNTRSGNLNYQTKNLYLVNGNNNNLTNLLFIWCQAGTSDRYHLSALFGSLWEPGYFLYLFALYINTYIFRTEIRVTSE